MMELFTSAYIQLEKLQSVTIKNIIGILKRVSKIPPLLLYNVANPSNSLRGNGIETQNFPNSSFSHNFCHSLSEKI